jgi:hypothetical protein
MGTETPLLLTGNQRRRHCGQTFTFRAVGDNTVVMVKNQNEIAGMTYDARFLVDSWAKYQVNRETANRVQERRSRGPPMPRDIH